MRILQEKCCRLTEINRLQKGIYMSDQDFILVDEEDKEKENNGQSSRSEGEQKQEVVSSDKKDGGSDKKDDDGYEKICFYLPQARERNREDDRSSE